MLALFLKLLKMTKIHRPEKKIQKNTTKEKDDEIKTECEFSRNFFSSLLVWTNKLEKKKIGKQHRSSSEMRKASVFQLEKLKEARFIKNILFYQWTPKRNKQSLRKNVKKLKKDTNFSCSVSKQKKEKHGKPQNSTQFEKKKNSSNLLPLPFWTPNLYRSTSCRAAEARLPLQKPLKLKRSPPTPFLRKDNEKSL